MKNKFRNQIKIISYLTSTEMFKILFIIGVIVAFYASFVLGSSTDNLIDAILIPYQFYIFNILFCALIFFNTMNTCITYEKDFSFYILRLENKKNYVREIIKNSIIVNLFYFLIYFLCYFTFLNLIKFENAQIHVYAIYTFSNLFYVIYYLARYMIILLLLGVISSLLYLNFGKTVPFLLNIVFWIGMPLQGMIEPISHISFVIWKFFNATTFSSFSLDICSSIGIIVLLEIIVLGLEFCTKKNRKLEIA